MTSHSPKSRPLIQLKRCLPAGIVVALVCLVPGVLPSDLASPAWSQDPTGVTNTDQNETFAPPQGDTSGGSLSYEGDLEFLTKAPLHEAFATPYQSDPQPSDVIDKQPPEPIREARPDFRPEGKYVQWIDGYWDWDSERQDFIWISGLWRDFPPGMEWVPGYWAETNDGYQRVVGFWTKADSQDWGYLPGPPESLEQGPSSPPPQQETFYVPGTWQYQDDGYSWRPGFWSRQAQNWVWVPARYIWTPHGCIFRDGYWDYLPTARGQVFTPVYYRRPIYSRPGYLYRPRYVINTGLNLLARLFIGPYGRSYYYGNYFGVNYRNQFTPWVRYGQNLNRWAYDPIYTYFARTSRNNVLPNIRRNYDLFESNQRFRPADTVRRQRDVLDRLSNSGVDATVRRLANIAEPFDEVVHRRDNEKRFDQLDRRISSQVDVADRLRNELRDRRAQFEAGARNAGRSVKSDTRFQLRSDASVGNRNILNLNPNQDRSGRRDGVDLRSRINVGRGEGRSMSVQPASGRRDTPPRVDGLERNIRSALENGTLRNRSAQRISPESSRLRSSGSRNEVQRGLNRSIGSSSSRSIFSGSSNALRQAMPRSSVTPRAQNRGRGNSGRQPSITIPKIRGSAGNGIGRGRGKRGK